MCRNWWYLEFPWIPLAIRTLADTAKRHMKTPCDVGGVFMSRTAIVQEALIQVERAIQQTPNLANILKAGHCTAHAACQSLQLLSPWMQCVAKLLDSTIAFGFGVEGGFLGLTADASLNLVWGENDAFALYILSWAGGMMVMLPLKRLKCAFSVGFSDVAGFGITGSVSVDASKYPNDRVFISGEGTIQTFDHNLCMLLSQGSSRAWCLWNLLRISVHRNGSIKPMETLPRILVLLSMTLPQGADGSIILAEKENAEFMKWDYTGSVTLQGLMQRK